VNDLPPAPRGRGDEKPTLAITGGTGFVGRHLLRIAVEAGHPVRALARAPQAPQPGITWVIGTLAAPGDLCAGADTVIHIAGVINARVPDEFLAGNVAGTASILAAASAAHVRRLVNVSSLAAREPALSLYGASKAAAEALVAASLLDHVTIRPPGVYGPGDRETLMVYSLAQRGFAVLPGPGRFSMIEVGDLARALLALAASDLSGVYEIDDGTPGGHSHAELADAVAAALHRRVRQVRLPVSALRIGAVIDTLLARRSGTLPRLSFDRARYLAHPDWVAAPARQLPRAVWEPQVTLADGIAATAAWYRSAGWLG